MFGGKQKNKKELRGLNTNIIPQSESNLTKFAMSPDAEEINTMPASVTEIMSIVRLSWDFMTTSEVL